MSSSYHYYARAGLSYEINNVINLEIDRLKHIKRDMDPDKDTLDENWTTYNNTIRQIEDMNMIKTYMESRIKKLTEQLDD